MICNYFNIGIVVYGYVPILFPNRIGEVVAYFELAVGFGQSIGANLGAIIK